MCGGCGGCGGGGGRDWASSLVAGPVARAEVATAAAGLLRAAGVPGRVTATAAGWSVASPTGAVAVVATLTDLWAAVPGWAVRAGAHGVPPLDRPPGRAAPPSGVAEVGGGRRAAVLVGVPAAAELAWADRVVEGDRSPQAAVDAVDASPAGARVLLLREDRAQVRPLLGALRATGAAQRSTVTALVGRGADRCAVPDPLDHLEDVDDDDVARLLDGALPPAPAGELLHAGELPAAAVLCWVAAAQAARSTGPRLRVSTAGGLVVDVAEGVPLGVRPEVRPEIGPETSPPRRPVGALPR